MLEISQALKEGHCPQAKVSKRGEWERTMPRNILTHVSLEVLTIISNYNYICYKYERELRS